MPQSTDVRKQSDIFLNGEGDNWFSRNKGALATRTDHHETGIIKRTLEPFRADISHILEIGCSNGVKLAGLCQHFDAKGQGIAPSMSAISEGSHQLAQQSQRSVNLQVGTAARLPFDDESFDLVYFGFCLYLVGRQEVYQAVAEADRVLKKGGFLAILDFDPGIRQKRPYSQKDGVYSYKTAHQDFFTAAGHYYTVAKESISHGTAYFSKDPGERVSVCVLYKEPEAY